MHFFVLFRLTWFGRAQRVQLRGLQANTQRLISSIDLHATFVELAHWPDRPTLSPEKRSALHLGAHARSLLGPIEPSRSCADLGIPESFCQC
jgi:hypothetical protein